MTAAPLSSAPAPGIRALLAIAAFGVALRLALLFAAGELELLSDETRYVYLALHWNHFGYYPDTHRYLWPPGYAFLLAQAMQHFGFSGLFALRLLQALACGAAGVAIASIAQRLFGARAARLAAWIWCLYLPLIGFSHELRTETFFLASFAPALLLLLALLAEPERPPERRLVAAGALFAAGLYLKEAPQFLSPLLALLIAWRAPGPGWREGLRRASLFLLVQAVLIAPWTLRNAEVYGRFVPVASSIGENAFVGLNGFYRNYELNSYARSFLDQPTPLDASRRWFIEPPARPFWERADAIQNTPDRMSENLRRGLAYAAAEPAWFLRSRIKKLADLVVPSSFFLRRLGLRGYQGSALERDGLRQALIVWALAGPLLLLPLALAGFALLRLRAGERACVALVLGYFGATALLVSMTRFRVPMLPLLIPLAAGLLARGVPAAPRGRGRLAAASLALFALGFLWWVDWPELRLAVDYAWNLRRLS